MDLRNRSVLVTGGAGFIGSHLVDQLVARQNRVTVFDNFATGSLKHLDPTKVRVIEGDVRDLESVALACRGVSVVFHLATHCVRASINDPKTNHEVNATGTLNVLMAARAANVDRFVYCSSSEVYGNIISSEAGTTELNEKSPKAPATVYGASKLVGEHYTLAFRETYGFAALIVRPFNAFGPRSHTLGMHGEVIPRFVILLASGHQPIIFGDGSQTRDFTFVTDTAAGLLRSAETDSLLGQSVNLGSGTPVSILELAAKIGKLLNKPVNPKFIIERPGDVHHLRANSTFAENTVGWKPVTSFDQGLALYIQWLQAQKLDFHALASQITDVNWVAKENAKEAA